MLCSRTMKKFKGNSRLKDPQSNTLNLFSSFKPRITQLPFWARASLQITLCRTRNRNQMHRIYTLSDCSPGWCTPHIVLHDLARHRRLDVAAVLGRQVHRDRPGRMLSTNSFLISSGARLPGMSAVEMIMSTSRACSAGTASSVGQRTRARGECLTGAGPGHNTPPPQSEARAVL